MTAAYANNGGVVGLMVAGDSLSAPVPAATALGDLLIAALWIQGEAAPVNNEGWAQLALSTSVDGTLAIYAQVAAGGDANPSWSWTGGAFLASAVVVRFVFTRFSVPVGSIGGVARGSLYERDLSGDNIVNTTDEHSLIINIDACSTAVEVVNAPDWQQVVNAPAPGNFAQFSLQTREVDAVDSGTGAMLYYGGAEPWAALQIEVIAGPRQYLNNDVLVNGLDWLKDNADEVHLTTMLAVDMETLGLSTIGYHNLGPGSVFPNPIAPGVPSGEQVTTATLTVDINTTGYAGYWAIVDSLNQILLASGPLVAKMLVRADSAISFQPITIRLPNIEG